MGSGFKLSGKSLFRKIFALDDKINSLTLPIATKTGLFYCYVKAGEKVDNNQLLGEIKNLEGKTLEEIKSPMSGIIEITVINPVIKAGDYVLAVVKKSN